MADPKWLVISEIGLDSGSEYESGGVVNHPTRTYEGRVLEWGSLEASIPTPSGIPRIGDAVIRIADTDRKWRNLLSVQTPRRRRVTTKFLQAGDSEAAADVIFSGEVKDGSFPEGITELQLRDTTFSWIDEMLPELVNQQNFPTFPDVNPAFFPIVLGHCQSRAIPPGSASGGPTKDPTGDSAAMAAKIAAADALITAYTAEDVTSHGFMAKVDVWVQYVENLYGQALALVINEVNRQYSNGGMLLTDLQDARDAVQANIDAFVAKAAAVGAIDSQWLQITNQAIQNQHNIFGSSFEFLLGPLDAKITEITSSPAAIASYVQGVIPLPHVGYLLGTGDRWAASIHQLWNVLAIYRKLPDETIFTVVDPAEFNVVEEDIEFIEYPGLTFTCVFIDFIAQQADGTEIRMDADGFYFRDVWNGMPAVGYDNTSSPPLLNQGPLRNPIDAFIHLTRVAFIKASAESGWDGADIEAIYNKLETGTDFTPPYFCDAAIVEANTPRELLGQFMSSFGLDFTTKQTGLQSLAFVDAEDPDRLEITEQMMVRGSFQEFIANPAVNQLVYSFARDYAGGKWMSQAVFDNAYDQTLLGLIEKGDLDLWFVRDQVTALSVASRYMQYVSLGSYQQEWQCPLPLVLDRMEMAQQVGITHRSGLELTTGYSNREVKIIGRTIDLGRMMVTLRSILRVPVRLPIAEEVAACTPWTTDTGVSAIDLPSMTQDADYVYFGNAQSSGVTDPKIRRFDRADGSEVLPALDIPRTWTDSFISIQSLTQNTTHIFAGVQEFHPDGGQNTSYVAIYKINKTTWAIDDSTTILTLTVDPNIVEIFQINWSASYVYAIARKGIGVMSAFKVADDFSTSNDFDFTAYGNIWRFTVDSTHLWFTGNDGSETGSEFSVGKATLSPFTLVASYLIDTGDDQGGYSSARLPITNDSTYLYVAFYGVPAGVIKITKANPAIYTVGLFTSDDGNDPHGIAYDGSAYVYVYANNSSFDLAVLRVATADLSNAIQSLASKSQISNTETFGQQPLLVLGAELTFPLVHISGIHAVKKICTFVAD